MTNPTHTDYEGPLTVTAAVYDAIKAFIGDHPAERGGMLGRNGDGVIRHFEPDPGGRCTTGAYDPDIDRLNQVIKQWKMAGITFCGFVHSHPRGICRPSGHDEWYAGEILACFKKLDAMWMPIVQTVPDTGEFRVFPYAAVPGTIGRKRCSVLPAEVKIVEPRSAAGRAADPVTDAAATVDRAADRDELAPARKMGAPSEGEVPERALPDRADSQTQPWAYHGNFPCIWAQSALNLDNGPDNNRTTVDAQVAFPALRQQGEAARVRDSFLVRIADAYDIGSLDRTRLVVIGTGGGASLVRNAARMGIGEFVLIDPDGISATNVASQQATPAHIGRSKVASLAEDIMATNPAAAVVTVCERIEEISDKTFGLMLSTALRGRVYDQHVEAGAVKAPDLGMFLQAQSPERVVLLVLTDNFGAQARGHRLGLQFGVPTICAQEYAEGRGAEVTYTVPGVTPACHRCITASRYREYLQNGYRNDVTSAGAPIFAAEFLNGVLGHILLAVVHHGTDHPRWGSMIRRLGAKNLIRIRMDPEFDETFGNTFARRQDGAVGGDAMIMLDTLFLNQTPDCGQSATRPVCPDCGGTGDLSSVIGAFDDTRPMRPETQVSVSTAEAEHQFSAAGS
ncbi:MAG: hypothetical protein HN742_00115 [Lentisphaerae bacterium]|jgi:hypothetical protein|nr:hypothetical protein [Lentisphaerota bacterium]MBT4816880.1 hypothetical protein [Lentisphaerota bacterium]MBT5608086.1 hypothetical protein [Lentisphaerota bacterium]MBT7057606.1 hypothetical protein [Lentisphaerota bacterium]MBT7840233.1 hypothetical protein [Lentisphaerota bacterium]